MLIDCHSGEQDAFNYANAYWPTHFGENLPTSRAILETLVGLPDTMYNSVDHHEVQSVILWLKVCTLVFSQEGERLESLIT